MKKIIYIMAVFIVYSCSKNEISEQALNEKNLSKERLSFEDFDQFINTYNELAKFNITDEFQNWIDNQGHESLLLYINKISQDTTVTYTRKDSISMLYSTPLKAILNKNLEFELNGEIVKLVDHNLYQLTNHNNLKENKLIGTVELNSINYTNKKDYSNKYRPLDPNEWVKLTKTFNANNGVSCSGSKISSKRDRKFIHEIYNETIRNSSGSVTSSKIYMRLRMDAEYCSFWRCKWSNQTEEKRKIDININGSVVNSGGSASINYSNVFNCVTGHVNILLKDLCMGLPSVCIVAPLSINLNGTIRHYHYQYGETNAHYVWAQDVADFN